MTSSQKNRLVTSLGYVPAILLSLGILSCSGGIAANGPEGDGLAATPVPPAAFIHYCVADGHPGIQRCVNGSVIESSSPVSAAGRTA